MKTLGFFECVTKGSVLEYGKRYKVYEVNKEIELYGDTDGEPLIMNRWFFTYLYDRSLIPE